MCGIRTGHRVGEMPGQAPSMNQVVVLDDGGASRFTKAVRAIVDRVVEGVERPGLAKDVSRRQTAGGSGETSGR